MTLRSRLRRVSQRYRGRRILTFGTGLVLLVTILLSFGHERRLSEITHLREAGDQEACEQARAQCETWLRHIGRPLRVFGRDCALPCDIHPSDP